MSLSPSVAKNMPSCLVSTVWTHPICHYVCSWDLSLAKRVNHERGVPGTRLKKPHLIYSGSVPEGHEFSVFNKITSIVTIKENCCGGLWVLLAFDSKPPLPSPPETSEHPVCFLVFHSAQTHHSKCVSESFGCKQQKPALVNLVRKVIYWKVVGYSQNQQES